MSNELLTAEEFAGLLDVSRSTLFRWKRQGMLPKPADLPGEILRWHRDDVTGWLRDRDREAGESTAAGGDVATLLTIKHANAVCAEHDAMEAAEQAGCIARDASVELAKAVATTWKLSQEDWLKRVIRREAGTMIQWALRRGYVTSLEYSQYMAAGAMTAPGMAGVDIAYENLVLAIRERCPNFVIEFLSQETTEGNKWADLADSGEQPAGQGDTVSMNLQTGRILATESE